MKKRKKNFVDKKNNYGYLFILPWVLGFILFYFDPLLQLLLNSMQEISVTDAGMATKFTGLDNIINIFSIDPDFPEIFFTSLTDIIVNIPIIVIFSILVAMVINSDFKGKGIARVIFFLPIILGLDLVVSLSEVANISQSEATVEVASGFLQADALENLLLNSSIPTAMSELLIGSVNRVFEIIALSGIQILIFLSALQSIPASQFEVARIEGATGYETFWKVVIPTISPMILLVTVYTAIDLFFRSPIAEEIHTAAFVDGEFGISAAMSISFLVSSLLLIGVIALIGRKVVTYNA